MFKNVCAGLLMIAIVAALVYAGSARAEDTGGIGGPYCKSVEGMDAAFEQIRTNTDAPLTDILVKVNGKLGSETCGSGHFLATKKDTVKTVEITGTTLDIVRFQVIGECVRPGLCMMVEPHDIYMAIPNTDTPT